MLRLSHELDLLDIVDSSKSITQAALAFFPIDKIRRSVDSTVKIDQSEGIAAPAIPEEGRERNSYRLSRRASP